MTARGIAVQPADIARIASLRYFEWAGAFGEAMAGVLGGALPKPGQAFRYPACGAGEVLLASCRPTETLVLCSAAAAFESLVSAAVGRSDGCVVDQSSGYWCVVVSGERAADLLVRMGSTTSIPALGEARIGRLADVAVSSLCVQSGEIVLLAERVYGEHISGWIRETLRDF